MVKKFIKVITICVFMILSINITKNVYAVNHAWNESDFVSEGDTLYGFSKEGIKKLNENPDVILPDEINGIKIKKVASFAFVHNKKTAIAEYTGRVGEFGEISNKDVDGNEIKDIGEEFNYAKIKSVRIPDGYVYIGQDAFSFNKNMTEVFLGKTIKNISEYSFAHSSLISIDLPSELNSIGDQAFFDNKITGTLNIPANVQYIGERAFKSNRIMDIKFWGNKISVIKEECFQDNKLSRLTIPLSIKMIDDGAFSGNDGDPEYGNMVVLLTENGENPNSLQDKGYYINPSDDKKNTLPEIDYSTWNDKDFKVEGKKILGFSQIGELKIKQNKNLVIPNSINGIEITEIADDAFRNIDFAESRLRKYDIESVQLPSNLNKIGNFAFQSNNISELETPESLVYIAKGAFMNNRIETLILNDKLEIIDDAAFHINNINAIVVPAGVKKIGISAFRQNGASFVMIMSPELEEIGDMAFTSNAIEKLDISTNISLKRIGVQAFRSNLISELLLPESVEEIAEEAFKENKLVELSVPDSIIKIAFNAFDYNIGKAEYDNKVVLNISDNIDIPDGDGYIAGPEKFTEDLIDLEEVLNKLKNLNLNELRKSTAGYFEDMIKKGEELLHKNKLRKGEKIYFINEVKFFLDRKGLDIAIKKANLSLLNPKVSSNVELLKDKLTYAHTAYNNSALKQEAVNHLIKELELLTNLVDGSGKISEAIMMQGHHELNTPLPIPPYHMGVNVYFDKSGDILYVLDMSYSIGKGTLDKYGNKILNVDEDNEGYHRLALPTLEDYEGINYKEILNKDINDINKIRKIDDRAAYHREGFYKAVQDAANEYKKYIESSKKVNSPKNVSMPKNGMYDKNTDYRKNMINDIEKKLPKTGTEKNFIYFVCMIIVASVVMYKTVKK